MTTHKTTLEQRVTDLIASQVPLFINENHPNFVNFMKAYYEWMETKFDQYIVEPTDGVVISFEPTEYFGEKNKIVLSHLALEDAVSIYSYLDEDGYIKTAARFKENKGPLRIHKKELKQYTGKITYLGQYQNQEYKIIIEALQHDLGENGTTVPIFIQGTNYYDGRYDALINDSNSLIIFTKFIAEEDPPPPDAVWQYNLITILTESNISTEVLKPSRYSISKFIDDSNYPGKTKVYSPGNKLNNHIQIHIIDSPDYEGEYIIEKINDDYFLIDKIFIVDNRNAAFVISETKKLILEYYQHDSQVGTEEITVVSNNHGLNINDQIEIVDDIIHTINTEEYSYNGKHTVVRIIDKNQFIIYGNYFVDPITPVTGTSFLEPVTVGPTIMEDSSYIGAIFGAKKLYDYHDVDETIDLFMNFFMKEFLKNIPINILCNKALLIKNINQFYKARGTERSWHLLFNIIFGAHVDFYYPTLDILRVDDGKWEEKKSILIRPLPDIYGRSFDPLQEFLNKRILGLSSLSTGRINSITKIWNETEYLYELFFEPNSIVGEFIPFEGIATSSTSLNIGSLLPRLNKISISYNGLNYTEQDANVFIRNSKYGIEYKAIISELEDDGSISKITITNYGTGYPVYPAVGTDALEVVFVDKGANTAIATASIGSLVEYPGYYITNDGFLDYGKKLRDDYYYQEYSYVVESVGISLKQYQNIAQKLVHPSGLLMFARVLLDNTFQVSSGDLLPTNESLVGNNVFILDQNNVTCLTDNNIDARIYVSVVNCYSNCGHNYRTAEKDLLRALPNPIGWAALSSTEIFPTYESTVSQSLINNNYWNENANYQISEFINMKINDFKNKYNESINIISEPRIYITTEV